MDLPEMRAFLAVVDEGGFRAAARARFVSQPVVTRLIHRLETEVGGPVFSRGPGGVRLTARGEQLLPTARRLILLLDRAGQVAEDSRSATLRLGVAATAAGSLLAPFLSTWIPAHPELRIDMLYDAAVSLRTRLLAGECDAAFIADPVPGTLEYLPLTTVDIFAVLPAGDPLADETGPLSVTELHGRRILLHGPPFLSTELLLSACRLTGTEPDIVYECPVGQTLAALTEAGLGITIVGDTVDLRGFDSPRRLIHDGAGTPLRFDMHIAWSPASYLPPIVMQFLRELSEQATARKSAG